MTLSSISNAGLPKSTISQQKSETDAKQADKQKETLSSGTNPSTIGDDVTLNQPEKTNVVAREIDVQEAKEMLPKTLQSILANSKAALSAQANTSPQTAEKILSSN